jgi:hypothetical protein
VAFSVAEVRVKAGAAARRAWPLLGSWRSVLTVLKAKGQTYYSSCLNLPAFFLETSVVPVISCQLSVSLIERAASYIKVLLVTCSYFGIR